MVKINKRLLPIKAHFFFFMAAMGPILPQLSVIGKQIGISPEVMGYITSVLPITYVIAKPIFGYIADYFDSIRKLIFMCLIAAMTLAYGAFNFIPTTEPHAIALEEAGQNWNVSVAYAALEPCSKELMARDLHCSASHVAHCVEAVATSLVPNQTVTNPHILTLITAVNASTSSDLNVSPNLRESYHICTLLEATQLSNATPTFFNGSCTLNAATHCIYSSYAFWLFICALFIGTIGFNVTNSISDAICFDMLGESEESKYGAQRVWGTIGFGLTAMLAGVVVDLWTPDTVKSFAPALIIMCFFSGLDLFSVSKLKLPTLSSSESIAKDVWELVTHPSIAIFLVFATLAGIIDSFIIYFMFWHVEDVAAQTGYMDDIKLIEGLVVAAECLAGEVPFFFYSGKIIKKLGYVHCMSMCFFFYAVRLGLIAWIPNPWYLVGVELFFQGVTYALCYTCIVAYASAVAPPGTSATVQGLMAGMDDGLGFSIGSLIGGVMFQRFGGRRSFKYFSIAALVTCILHILIRPSSRKRQYLPKSSGASAGYQLPTEQANLKTLPTEQELLEQSKR